MKQFFWICKFFIILLIMFMKKIIFFGFVGVLCFVIFMVGVQLIVRIVVFLTEEEGVVSDAGHICLVSGVLVNFLMLGLYFFL